jgi:hypothetical protein
MEREEIDRGRSDERSVHWNVTEWDRQAVTPRPQVPPPSIVVEKASILEDLLSRYSDEPGILSLRQELLPYIAALKSGRVPLGFPAIASPVSHGESEATALSAVRQAYDQLRAATQGR